MNYRKHQARPHQAASECGIAGPYVKESCPSITQAGFSIPAVRYPSESMKPALPVQKERDHLLMSGFLEIQRLMRVHRPFY